MAERDKKKKSNKRDTGIGLALWILAALILLVAFLMLKPRIDSNLKQTDAFNKLGLDEPESVKNAKVPETGKNDVNPMETVEIDLNDNSSSKSTSTVTAKNETAKNQQNAQKEIEAAANNSESKVKTEAKNETTASNTKKETSVKKDVKVTSDPVKTMELKLFFMYINSEGKQIRTEVVRTMKKSESPLMDAINALIAGPSAEEEKKYGCITMIPRNTKLIGASVRNGVATLNFNDEFEYNQYGTEGLRNQVIQIVYTATAFRTVESVQILVAGEKREFLGSEGVWIGSPLNRNSF
jgi:spore germination protein GerM